MSLEAGSSQEIIDPHEAIAAFALDRSARTVDQDGHLRVKGCKLTAAVVNPYRGGEIPDYAELGLKRDTIYQLYRDAKALELATPTLEGKPLLLEHRPVTADDHPSRIVVGTVTNPEYKDGEIIADLIVWSQSAINEIESEEKRELSCGYRYRPVMEDGSAPNGDRFEGRMIDILFNHVSLVESGRVPGAVVADSADYLQWELLGSVVEDFAWASLGQAFDEFKESDHPRATNGQFGSGGTPNKSEAKSNLFRDAIRSELDSVLSNAGAANIDELRLYAAEGRADAIAWKKANRRFEKLEMEAIDRAYGKDYEGPVDSKRVEPFYSDEARELERITDAFHEKYEGVDADDLAIFAKGAPKVLAKAEKLHERLNRK